MERILVVEDDETIKNELITLLRANGYQPVQELPCDLALLDVNLPRTDSYENGFEICRKIKQSSSVPVIFLTARESAEDELVGFGVGADDYIKKPYHSSVLLARIARLLKKNPALIRACELVLDPSSLTLFYLTNSVTLTKNEMRILACLMQKSVVTKEELIENLWLNGCYIDENTLYVNISRLREKLKSLGAEGYLTTVRGVGYRL